jgi:hypothetical protein
MKQDQGLKNMEKKKLKTTNTLARSPKMADHDKPERFGRDESLFIETSRTLRRPN